MSLLFNVLPRLVITFLPRSKHLLISWLQSPAAVIFEPKIIKSATVSTFPHLFAMSDGTRCHELSFLNVKAMVFPVVMYGCESWTIRQLSTKELMLLKCGVGEDLRVPWTARRSNQSFLKESSPGYSLKGQKLKLKLQYFGHLMRRADSFEKTLMLGKIEGRRRKG